MTRDNLIATPTVDKNGKTTTVYRKTAPSAAAKALPVPKLAGTKRGAQKPATPLPVPPRLSDKDYQYIRNNHRDWFSMRYHPITRDEADLLNRIRQEGTIPDDLILSLSRYMGINSIGERIGHYDRNVFLLAERVCRDEGADFVSQYPSLFMDAVEGLARRRREADSEKVPPIATEEELESHAAVVKMLVVAGSIEPLENPSFKREEFHTANGTRHNGSYFKNHSFTALLRERPEDYPRIEAYVRTRGVPRKKADVELLREYLDSEHAVQPLAEGWL